MKLTEFQEFVNKLTDDDKRRYMEEYNSSKEGICIKKYSSLQTILLACLLKNNPEHSNFYLGDPENFFNCPTVGRENVTHWRWRKT